MNHQGVIIATDGAVKNDGKMEAAYVLLGDRLPACSFVVLCPPLMDSLTSLQKLQNLQRRDFQEWLQRNCETVQSGIRRTLTQRNSPVIV